MRFVISFVVAGAVCTVAAPACVSKPNYNKALADAATLRRDLEKQLSETQQLKEALTTERAQLSKDLGATSAELVSKAAALELQAAQADKLGAKLETTSTQLASAEAKTVALGGEVTRLSDAEKKLLTEKQRFEVERAELANEVSELKRMRAAAERRSDEFRELIERLAKMIDSGSLEVSIRNGQMLVSMSSDVLFASGKAELKDEAVTAITELAHTIKTFENRRFQVTGHSDSRPIHSEEWDSNWELSSQRAIQVAKVLIAGGVPRNILSAAAYVDSDPVAKNNTRRGRARNRRVELVFMPKLDELPGFERALAK